MDEGPVRVETGVLPLRPPIQVLAEACRESFCAVVIESQMAEPQATVTINLIRHPWPRRARAPLFSHTSPFPSPKTSDKNSKMWVENHFHVSKINTRSKHQQRSRSGRQRNRPHHGGGGFSRSDSLSMTSPSSKLELDATMRFDVHFRSFFTARSSRGNEGGLCRFVQVLAKGGARNWRR